MYVYTNAGKPAEARREQPEVCGEPNTCPQCSEPSLQILFSFSINLRFHNCHVSHVPFIVQDTKNLDVVSRGIPETPSGNMWRVHWFFVKSDLLLSRRGLWLRTHCRAEQEAVCDRGRHPRHLRPHGRTPAGHSTQQG